MILVPQVFFVDELISAYVNLLNSACAALAADGTAPGWPAGYKPPTVQYGDLKLIRATGGLPSILDAILVCPLPAISDLEGNVDSVQVPIGFSGSLYKFRVLYFRAMGSGNLEQQITIQRTQALACYLAANPDLRGMGLPASLAVERSWPSALDCAPKEREAIQQAGQLTQVDVNAITLVCNTQAPRF